MANRSVAQSLPRLRLHIAGPIVVAWQQFLIDKGHDTSGCAADGMLGKGGVEATKSFQRSVGLDEDGIVGASCYEKAIEAGFDADALGYGGSTDPKDPGSVPPYYHADHEFAAKIIDHQKVGQARLLDAEKRKGKKLFRQPRKKTLVGLVLHQMGFYRKGDTIDKYDDITAHYIITQQGELAQLHPHDCVLFASNELNSTTIAVEFAGNFVSTNGGWYKPDKNWACYLTPQQVSAGRYLLSHLKESGVITHVYTHIQSDGKNRTNCAGPDIWASVGQWGVDCLGLSDGGPDFKVGDGVPIPAMWRSWGRSV